MAQVVGPGYLPAVTRLLAIALVLWGLALAPELWADDCADCDDCEEEAEHHAEAQDGCESPCDGEGEDGTCPPDCSQCVCCPGAASSSLVPAPVNPEAEACPVSAPPPEPADPLPDGLRRRIYRPPRTALS